MYFRLLLPLAVMILIFTLSHIPDNNLPSLAWDFDKICHAIAYGTLAATCIYASYPWLKKKPGLLVPGVMVIIFSLLYGISDEYHQSFINGRTSSFQDILADFVGASLAVVVWYAYIRKK